MSGKDSAGVAENYYYPHMNVDKRYATNTTAQRVRKIESMYVRVLTEMAVNRFKWVGLPEEVDVRWLELSLFNRALAVFYHDPTYDKYFALNGSGAGNMNMVGNPTKFLVTGNNFVSRTLDEKDCVPIWANYLRAPDLDIVHIFAGRLAELDRTIEINSLSARRTPVIIGNENQMMSLNQIMRQINEGQAAVKVNKQAFEMDSIQTFNMGIDPDTLEKLDILQSRIWGKCMGLLGINNGNQDKKERLVAAEVNQNDDQVAATRAINLNQRQVAAEKISKKYKLNVEVMYQVDYDNPASEEDPEDEAEPSLGDTTDSLTSKPGEKGPANANIH